MIIEQPLVPVTTSAPSGRLDPADEGGVRRSRWPWPVQAIVPVVGLAASLAVAVAAIQGLTRVLGVDSAGPEATGGTAAALAIGPGVVVTAVAVGLTALALRLDGRRRLLDVVGRVGGRRHLLGLLVGLVISFVVVVGVGAVVTATAVTRTNPDLTIEGPVALAVIIGLAQAFGLQGIPEELLFRGYLLRSVRLRPWSALLVSAVAFGIIHLVSSGGQQNWGERLLYLAVPTGFALTAGALVLTTGSVASAIGIHGGLHAATLVASLLAPTFPALAIGEGPAVWLATGAAYALAAVVIMVGWGRSPDRRRRP